MADYDEEDGVRTTNLPKGNILQVIGHINAAGGEFQQGVQDIDTFVLYVANLIGAAPAQIAEYLARLQVVEQQTGIDPAITQALAALTTSVSDLSGRVNSAEATVNGFTADNLGIRISYYVSRPGEFFRGWTSGVSSPAASAVPLVLGGPYSITTDGPGGGPALRITGPGSVTSIAKTHLDDTDVWDFTFRLARRFNNAQSTDNLPIIQFRCFKADGSNNGTISMPVTVLLAADNLRTVTHRISLIPGVGPNLPNGTRFVSPLVGERGASGVLEISSVDRARMPAIEQADTPAGPTIALLDLDNYAMPPRGPSYNESTDGGALGAFIGPDDYAVAIGTGAASGAAVVNDLTLRDAQNAEYSRSYTTRINIGGSRLLWNYNVVLGYGQSLSIAQEGWPAKTKIPMFDNMMLGNSIRGSGFVGNTFNQFGEAVLRPMVANVVSGGVILTDAQVATLQPEDGSAGEDSVISFCHMTKHLWNQDRGVLNDPDRVFVAASCGKGLRSIAQLSKGAAGAEASNYLRLMDAAQKIKAAVPAGKTSGLFAIHYNQGEEDYNENTTKAAYKAGVLKLYDDIYADICQGIFGQTIRPMFFLYQTGGRYSKASPVIAQAQLELAREYPDRFILISPNGAVTDKLNGHLDPNGYRWQGSHAAKAGFRHLKGGRHTAPFIYKGSVVGTTIYLDYCSLYALQWKMPYLGSVAVDDPNKGFVATDSLGALSFTPELVGNRIVALRCTRAPSGTVTITNGSLAAPVSGNTFLADTDPTVSLFNYEYTAGSGDYAEANIPALVGKPYDLATFALAQTLTLTV